MNEPTLEELLRQSLELQERIIAMKAVKAEEARAEAAKQNELRRAEELKRPVIVTFEKVRGNYIYVKNEPYRDDILDIIKSIPNRVWSAADKSNVIPIGSYEELLNKLKQPPRVEVQYSNGTKEAIHEELYAPDFHCELGERQFLIKASRRAQAYNLRRIPGYDYDYNKSAHRVPLSEGWRLHEFSTTEEVKSFIWTDDAKAFVIKQIEQRLRLDEIAKATDVELEIPNLKAILKNFQKIGIKFFELNGGRGILADEMGTGKTVQMIGLIIHSKFRACVVCPAALKENWIREVRKFAPHLVTYTCQGEAPTAFDMKMLLTTKPDIVIINYDIIGRKVEEKYEDKNGFTHKRDRFLWVELLNLLGLDICVLDEGHYIKNIDAQRSKGVRLLEMPNAISLTGTPILNRPQELWAMLHVADRQTFPSFETFKNQYTYDGKTVRNVEELKSLLKPLMIRRLKRDVIKELEPINRVNSYYELSEKGRKLYDKVLGGIFEVLAEWNPSLAGAQQKVTNMLVQIQRLKQVVAIDGVEGTATLATEIYDASPEATDSNKVLIFSQFKATTYATGQRLGAETLSFVTRSGNEFVTADNQRQQQLIDQFQTDPSVHFLCVTEKTAKEGHNITAAKAVIFNDLFWTPAGHQQAEARAYGRISDLHTIDSYYRIGINSISEHIMELLAAKMRLIEQVVEGVEASRADTSIVHELLAKLKEEMWTIKKK